MLIAGFLYGQCDVDFDLLSILTDRQHRSWNYRMQPVALYGMAYRRPCSRWSGRCRSSHSLFCDYDRLDEFEVEGALSR